MTKFTPRERFLRACRNESTDRPPIWMMRQAGRSLPEYRKLKAERSFTQLVRAPETAAEITLQPLRRFGFDAAIVFSDILVTAEALGAPYELLEPGGIRIDFDFARDLARLEPGGAADRLSYAAETARRVRKALGDERALIGFAGSPWTVAAFMLEGGSFREPLRALAALYAEPARCEALLEKLTLVTIEHLRAQIAAGADAIQLFDTLGGALPPGLYRRFSGQWMERIVRELPEKTPVIVFAKGVSIDRLEPERIGARVVGADRNVRLRALADRLPKLAVQGNLDPALLLAPPEIAGNAAKRLLDEMRGRNGFIFNLAHGVPPDARLESIEAVAETVAAAG